MTNCSSNTMAQKRRFTLAHTQEVQAACKATRRSERIRAVIEKSPKSHTASKAQSQYPSNQKELSNPEESPSRAGLEKKRIRNPNDRISTEQPRKRIQTQKLPHSTQTKRKRVQEEEVHPSRVLPESSPKRLRTSAALTQSAIAEARIEFWREGGIWPTEEQEATMDRFRDIVHHALARKRSSASLRRKRSDASISVETVLTRTPSDQQPREQKSAPYKHPRYEGQLRERGSFMGKHEDGITAESRRLCQKLLRAPQSPPEHTLFDDDIFEDTLSSIKGRNETRVVRDIAQLIVPPAEILAIRGAQHLKILRETTNAGWNNAIPFCGPRPQPDYSLGFKREAFNREQLQKLQPFIGNELEDCSYVAATYDMYLPFLTCEVKCGAAALDIADRQNAHNQTVALQNLIELFRLVGREKELHQEICGFSISHSDVDVRIWGHYPVVEGRDSTFYRHPIGEFSINNTELDREKRWTAYTFVRNVYDLWLPEHFKRICSAIDMLPADLDFEVVDQPLHFESQENASARSDLSQQFDDYRLADEGAIPESRRSVQQITPETTVRSGLSDTRRKKKK